MKIAKIILPFIIVIILSYFAIKPFILPGFFPIHDDTQVQRVFEMHKSLSDGMFPVRWVSDLGYNYGYPIFNFYAPLAYYVGGLFIFFGLDALIATKIMMVLGIILSGVFMYLLAKEFWGKAGGIISAILYLYAPYHALDIYVRGDIAEFWSYSFIPLVFLAVYKIFIISHENSKLKVQSSKLQFKVKSKVWMRVCISAIAYAAVILSHNLTAMMVTPFIFIAAFGTYIHLRTKTVFYKPYLVLAGLLLGLLLSAFYWLPVFPEMKYTNVLSQIGGGADYKDHFVCLPQLWDSPWGFGGSTPTCIDGLSFKIGKLHIILFIVSLVSIFFLGKKEKVKFWISAFAAFSVLFSIFLTLNQSKFIWDAVSPMAFIQYPWRFILLTAFFISFLGGSILWLLKIFLDSHFPFGFSRDGRENDSIKYLFNTLCIIFVFIIIHFNKEIFVPQTILHKTAKDYTNNYTLHWTTSRISDEYMPKNFYKPQNANEIFDTKFPIHKSNLQIISLTEKTNNIHVEVIAKNKEDVKINLAYFPTWHVFVDGQQVWFKYFNKGLIITVPSGQHAIDIEFSQTPIENLANILSLSGVFILLLGIINFWRKDRHAKTTT